VLEGEIGRLELICRFVGGIKKDNDKGFIWTNKDM
jgi:hypothetical protein